MEISGEWDEAYLRPLGRGLRLGPVESGSSIYFDEWLSLHLTNYSLSSGAFLKHLRITIQIEENEVKQ